MHRANALLSALLVLTRKEGLRGGVAVESLSAKQQARRALTLAILATRVSLSNLTKDVEEL